MRHLQWLSLVLVLLALRADAGGDPTADPAPALRFLSYNLHHGGVLSGLSGQDEDLDRRLRIAVDELRALNPDVIGLQEASVGRRRGNVTERLAKELGSHYVFASALPRFFPIEGVNRFVGWLLNFREGPAILSRFPIVDWEVHDLPRCSGFFDPRVLIYATLRTTWGDLGVASTHTTRGFCEADRLVAVLEARRGRLPIVLMGDFNAEEHSPAIRRLTQQSGFVDAFRAANRSAPGLTLRQDVRAPLPTVRRRVDYVFLVPGRAVPGRVRASRVVLDDPRTQPGQTVLWPSDHYGVLAEIEVFAAVATPATEREEKEAGAPPGAERLPEGQLGCSVTVSLQALGSWRRCRPRQGRHCPCRRC
jgi:endonuclease/exonuclease/phosphatase family metal-dependent hydrolase